MGARTRGLANNVLTSGKLDATDAVSGVIPASNIANASLTSATSYGSVTGGVPQVASDPPSPAEGDIWYNTTSGQIKFQAFVQSWATGGTMSTVRNLGFPSGAGTQTASFAAGGQNSPSTNTTATEEYNGSTWTAGGNLPAGKEYGAGMGTLTAGLAASGSTGTGATAATEEYDGSAWTAGGSVNTARYATGGCGIQTAGLLFGGTSPLLNATEEYDGTSWATSPGSLNTGRYNSTGTGTQTAGLAFGGNVTPTVLGATEEYNGTSWATSPGSLNTVRSGLGGSGTTSAALAFGVFGPPYT